jgi:hypothetical protein
MLKPPILINKKEQVCNYFTIKHDIIVVLNYLVASFFVVAANVSRCCEFFILGIIEIAGQARNDAYVKGSNSNGF